MVGRQRPQMARLRNQLLAISRLGPIPERLIQVPWAQQDIQQLLPKRLRRQHLLAHTGELVLALDDRIQELVANRS